tara:strand:- start:316 stop:462 length:147 start_codon:yes stop_codon:yes gene_type:complete
MSWEIKEEFNTFEKLQNLNLPYAFLRLSQEQILKLSEETIEYFYIKNK